jgi:hypothetical protein
VKWKVQRARRSARCQIDAASEHYLFGILADSSEDPWGGGLPTLHGGASARNRPDTERDIRGYDGMHEGRKQTNTWSAYAGSRLELSDALGRRRPKRHPSSRTGENPPYGRTE